MSVKDDLDDYKLDTAFQSDPTCVVHKSYKIDRARGFRKAEVLEKWFPHGTILGAGTFGTVRLERRVSFRNGKEMVSEERAVKQLYKWQLKRLKVDFRKELLALSKFSRSKFRQYQVFVEFCGWYENEECIFLAMEYFPLGTLGAFIDKEIKEDDARSIATQLLEGLAIMHSEYFTHRDLKPENIFVVQVSPEWWIKIGDFGISKRVFNNNTIMQTATGSPNYLAPEVRGYHEILSGAPFPQGPLVGRASKDGIEFVKSALQPNPIHRPAASQMLDATWLQIDDSGYLGQSLNMDDLVSSSPAPVSNDGNCEAEDEQVAYQGSVDEVGDQTTITSLEGIQLPPPEKIEPLLDTANSPNITSTAFSESAPLESTSIGGLKPADINVSESSLASNKTVERRLTSLGFERKLSEIQTSGYGLLSPSITIPPDGSPVTILTKRRGKGKGLTLNKSQTSLLIEYFEGGKDENGEIKRPSVRVKAKPSSKRRSSRLTVNDDIRMTERKITHKAPYTKRPPKRIPLSPGGDGNDYTYRSTSEESYIKSRGSSPVELIPRGEPQSPNLATSIKRPSDHKSTASPISPISSITEQQISRISEWVEKIPPGTGMLEYESYSESEDGFSTISANNPQPKRPQRRKTIDPYSRAFSDESSSYFNPLGSRERIPIAPKPSSRRRSRSQERVQVAAVPLPPSATLQGYFDGGVTISRSSLPYPSFSKAHSKERRSGSPLIPSPLTPRRRNRSGERVSPASSVSGGRTPSPKTGGMFGSMRANQIVRGIPRHAGVDDGNSTDTTNSNDEEPPVSRGIKLSKKMTPPLETIAQPKQTSFRNLMSILGKKKVDPTSKVANSDKESAARRDTRSRSLERTPNVPVTPSFSRRRSGAEVSKYSQRLKDALAKREAAV